MKKRLRSLRSNRSDVERSAVWIFGTPRSGSTWLLNIMSRAPGVMKIDEFGIGSHLGLFTSEALGTPPPRSANAQEIFFDRRRTSDDYVFADRYVDSWLPPLRALLLDRLGAQIDGSSNDVRIAVIKEPNGTQSAPVILRALPASRVLGLVRDGRDVCDSMLDAMQPDSWLSSSLAGGKTIGETERMDFLVHQAHRWVARTSALLQAFEAHDDKLRMMLRYEDLLADTLNLSRAIFDWLGVAAGDEIDTVVRNTSYDNISADKRGKGQFIREARPGAWREHLRDDEQRELTDIMRDNLAALGYTP